MTIARRSLLFASLWAGVLTACSASPSGGSTGAGSGTDPGGAGGSDGRRKVYQYGAAAAQNAELLLPEGTPRGVVLLVHGGYWQAGYDRTLEDAVAADLVAAQWAVWNVDYRAVGDGGGWPMTYADVAAGADYLAVAAREHDLPLDTLVAVGHSAGGALAGWLAARPQLPAGAVGAAPAVRVTALCTQAGVNDLAAGSRDDLGGGAVNSVVGGPPDRYPDRYAIADTSQHLPLGIPLLVVTGADDEVVPVYQSRDFAAAAEKAGDDVQLRVVAGEGHFEHLEPATGVWRELRTWLDALA